MPTFADMRFHQSHAKVLLTESPAELRHQLEHGRVATEAMEGGSLLDYLVFGLDQKYEVVDARYLSGDREGEQATDWTGTEAKLARKATRARGLVPALPCEIAELEPQVRLARERFAELAGYDRVLYQPKHQWTSEFGLACEGTPDCVMMNASTGAVRVVDLKRTASVNPRFLRRQIRSMCWDVQGAAYRELALDLALSELDVLPHYAGHTLVACQADGRRAVRVYPIDEVFLELGRIQWERAQRQWQECTAKNRWPDFPEDPIGPSRWQVSEVIGVDESDDDVGALGLEKE